MDYEEYFLAMAIEGDGPPLTDHGPATDDEAQALRRSVRRDAYRSVLMIDTEIYLEEINE